MERPEIDPRKVVHVVYTNWRGKTRVRRIYPIRIYWGKTEYHPEEQWLLEVWDIDKDAPRTYAMKDIHAWFVPENNA